MVFLSFCCSCSWHTHNGASSADATCNVRGARSFLSAMVSSKGTWLLVKGTTSSLLACCLLVVQQHQQQATLAFFANTANCVGITCYMLHATYDLEPYMKRVHCIFIVVSAAQLNLHMIFRSFGAVNFNSWRTTYIRCRRGQYRSQNRSQDRSQKISQETSQARYRSYRSIYSIYNTVMDYYSHQH
ncbi:hypothetical protein BZA77DRAFT_303191 [Pyronema omphalodes]|nr:hypothetical protein BZA77DRAFT_303191 [Pyronema omphalodes]